MVYSKFNLYMKLAIIRFRLANKALNRFIGAEVKAQEHSGQRGPIAIKRH